MFGSQTSLDPSPLTGRCLWIGNQEELQFEDEMQPAGVQPPHPNLVTLTSWSYFPGRPAVRACVSGRTEIIIEIHPPSLERCHCQLRSATFPSDNYPPFPDPFPGVRISRGWMRAERAFRMRAARLRRSNRASTQVWSLGAEGGHRRGNIAKQ